MYLEGSFSITRRRCERRIDREKKAIITVDNLYSYDTDRSVQQQIKTFHEGQMESGECNASYRGAWYILRRVMTFT